MPSTEELHAIVLSSGQALRQYFADGHVFCDLHLANLQETTRAIVSTKFSAAEGSAEASRLVEDARVCQACKEAGA